jgi:hypothetical protein
MNTCQQLTRGIAVALAVVLLLIGFGGHFARADDNVTYPSTYEGPQDFEDSCESAGGDVIDGYDSEGYLSWSECQIDGDSIETCTWGWDGDTCSAGGEIVASDNHPTGHVTITPHTGTKANTTSTHSSSVQTGGKIVPISLKTDDE